MKPTLRKSKSGHGERQTPDNVVGVAGSSQAKGILKNLLLDF
jgi:hypothetical protein